MNARIFAGDEDTEEKAAVLEGPMEDIKYEVPCGTVA